MEVTLTSNVVLDGSNRGGEREPRTEHTTLFRDYFSAVIESARENGQAVHVFGFQNDVPAEFMANIEEWNRFSKAVASYRTRYKKEDSQYGDLDISVRQVRKMTDGPVQIKLTDGTIANHATAIVVTKKAPKVQAQGQVQHQVHA